MCRTPSAIRPAATTPPPSRHPPAPHSDPPTAPPAVDYDADFLNSRLGLLQYWVQCQRLSVVYDTATMPFTADALFGQLANKPCVTCVVFTTDDDVFGFSVPKGPDKFDSGKRNTGCRLFSLFNHGRTDQPVLHQFGDKRCVVTVNKAPNPRFGILTFSTNFSQTLTLHLGVFYENKFSDRICTMSELNSFQEPLSQMCVGRTRTEHNPATFYLRRLVVFASS